MLTWLCLLTVGSAVAYFVPLNPEELSGDPGYQYQFPEQFLEENLQELQQEADQGEGHLFEDELRIPGEKPSYNDTYLCSAFRQDAPGYVVKFEALADQHMIHHIILFGCEAPGVQVPVPSWNCGEMSPVADPAYLQAPPCANNPNIVYAWAKGAPELTLPEGVAFPIGPGTKNRFLVLQVHYMHTMQKEDYSGIKIQYTEIPQPRTAATLLTVTGGELQPKAKETFEAACVMNEPMEIHPFAFRVHTHKRGTKVSGWTVTKDEKTGEDEWHLIGERDPQKEQLFETVKNTSMVIKPGDIIASRCYMDNDEDRLITMGPTGADEMCNFYMMYWVEGEQTLSENTCYSPGAPEYRFAKQTGLTNIPK
ncbi:unnamed protein product [Bursaphelenchus xylophilus]|uniref:peptidylglycine monooxygenase n=1 Tax=Bursaphelenchus xylophilus TaxID=6326 RepID=A0A1I7RVA7_BURXY|nr:unnamed protein product [Bursaphelenchus xylophilus]CAG9086616.1 unnamed protein product [Bursaphelenchus xylophilus]